MVSLCNNVPDCLQHFQVLLKIFPPSEDECHLVPVTVLKNSNVLF